MYNFCKQVDIVINIATNIVREINYQKTAPFIGSLQAIIYQIAKAHSKSVTIVRKIYFTVVICIYLIVLYTFCVKQSFSNLSSFHFQTKDSDTYGYACRTVMTETSKKPPFGPVSFITCFYVYWIAIPFIGIIFFCWKVFFRWIKETCLVLFWYYHN